MINTITYNTERVFALISKGEFNRIWREVHFRLYRYMWEILWPVFKWLSKVEHQTPYNVSVLTSYTIAESSPDHIAPKGTAQDNNTNKKFVLKMFELIRSKTFGYPCVMDLGCSGGQMVKDFLSLGAIAVGLEGSDYSRKVGRKHWPELDGTHLFTCDITKQFYVANGMFVGGFHLITAWEVLEHIKIEDLNAVFSNVVRHLKPGGLFIATTCDLPDVYEGVELHQTKMTEAQWKCWIHKNYGHILKPIDLGFKPHELVRYNFQHPSVLMYQRV